MNAGRSCPLSYRYSPSVFCSDATLTADTLYVVGGLYGNEAALDAVLQMFDAERGRKQLIFNGDFNWFNISPDRFRRINETVLSFNAIRGNVETELMSTDVGANDAGCGCTYPDWVEDDTVERSNLIMQKLSSTARQFPSLQEKLAALPMWQRIDVGGIPIGIVHGDAESLSGWGFAQETLSDVGHLAQVRDWFDIAKVRLFACSHTCLPVLKSLFNSNGKKCVVVNNGAAGMPNFQDLHEGLLTRIATTPYNNGVSFYGTKLNDLFIDALPIRYDQAKWHEEFLSQWDRDSPAHASYWDRIAEGPRYLKEQACRSVIF